MIIRMIVEDNDFTEMLEDFANDLKKLFFQETKSNFQETKSNYENDYNPEILHQLIETEETIRQTLWAGSIKEVTEEGKILLKARLYIMWGKYVDSGEQEDRIKDYLKRDFTVSFSFNFEDKWENGEAVYYFTTADKWISQ
jgi:hypothetical protein